MKLLKTSIIKKQTYDNLCTTFLTLNDFVTPLYGETPLKKDL